jgi:hypothetical protein
MENNFVSNVKLVPESVYNTMWQQIVNDEEKPRFVVAYIYNDIEGPNFDYRALSMDPVL